MAYTARSWNKSGTSRLTAKPDKVVSGNRDFTASHINVVQVKRKEIKESIQKSSDSVRRERGFESKQLTKLLEYQNS